VLYWFRTPPGVKVGRVPLDDESIRLIEQLNPGVAFDWPRILKGQGTPPTEPRPPMEARRPRHDRERGPERNERERGQDRNDRHEARRGPQAPRQPVPSIAPAVSETAVEEALPIDAGDPSAPRAENESEAEPLRSAERAGEPEAEPPTDDPWLAETLGAVRPSGEIPAHAKLGEEGVRRLRARYVEIINRIAERTADVATREQLKGQAERLNPDAWLTGEDVVQGLEQYESVLASLRDVVGQRRRRRRGRAPLSDGHPTPLTPGES
jgi:hypothetical protein